MSLHEEEVPKDDADEKEASADGVGKKVRKCGEDARGRKQGGHGDGGAGKEATNRWPNDRTDRPYERHHGICPCWGRFSICCVVARCR